MRLRFSVVLERLHDTAPSVPVIVWTGYAVDPFSEKDLSRAKALLRKPFRAAEFRELVAEVLGA